MPAYDDLITEIDSLVNVADAADTWIPIALRSVVEELEQENDLKYMERQYVHTVLADTTEVDLAGVIPNYRLKKVEDAFYTDTDSGREFIQHLDQVMSKRKTVQGAAKKATDTP